jgi:hypothetical protein
MLHVRSGCAAMKLKLAQMELHFEIKRSREMGQK